MSDKREALLAHLKRSLDLRKRLKDVNKVVESHREYRARKYSDSREALLSMLVPNRICPLCNRFFPKNKSWVVNVPPDTPVRCKSCWTSNKGKWLLSCWRSKANNDFVDATPVMTMDIRREYRLGEI